MKNKINNKLLSICIPTYNRANLLDETLKSIFDQITSSNSNHIEICISDNASTDNTIEIIKKWKNKKKVNIINNRNNKNLGADKNYIKSVAIANGRYCWFMGSDDILINGSLKRVLNELKSDNEIYLFNRIDCDFKMTPLKESHWLDKKIREMTFQFSNRNDFLKYLRLSRSLGALFSYLSCIVFKKEAWNNIKYDEIYTGTGYSHSFILLSMRQAPCKLKYIGDPIVLCRGFNDSFGTGGVAKRVMLDLNGYILLANELYNKDAQLKKEFLNIMKHQHSYVNIIKISSLIKNKQQWIEMKYKFATCGYNILKLEFCYFIGRFEFIINIGTRVKRSLVKI